MGNGSHFILGLLANFGVEGWSIPDLRKLRTKLNGEGRNIERDAAREIKEIERGMLAASKLKLKEIKAVDAEIARQQKEKEKEKTAKARERTKRKKARGKRKTKSNRKAS